MGVAVRGWLAAVACAFAALTFGAGFGEPAIADDLGTPYATSATTARLAVKRGLVAIDPPGHPRISLYAEESGHGETLVLLHGLGASGYTFRRIVPDLARRYRVVTVDLKGHGRSDKPFDLNYSPHDQAVFIYWFLRAYDDFGNVVGSHQCEEGQIFIEPQGFCALAGIGMKDGKL